MIEDIKPLISDPEETNGSESDTQNDSDSDSDNESLPSSLVEKNIIAKDNANKEGVLRLLKVYVSCLMDLLSTMENTRRWTNNHLDFDEHSLPTDFQVSEQAKPYCLSVLDKFPNIVARFGERLGEANWQRHVELRKTFDLRYHRSNDHEFDKIVETTSEVIPLSKFHDSGLGISLPAHSRYAETVASHSSFQSSVNDGDSGTSRVPPTPKEVFDGLPFTCSICWRVLTGIKNRIDWKRHVFSDLKPYICTFSDCKDHLLTFPSRKLWELHEFGQHRMTRRWSCHKCSHMDSSEAEWKAHLEEIHGVIFTGQQLEVARQTAEKKPHAIGSEQCPFCLQRSFSTRREFVKHVAKHMEGIALVALPLEAESDSEEASVSEVSIHSQHGPNASPKLVTPRWVTEDEWVSMKPLFKSLYIDKNMTFSQVRDHFYRQHDFYFTKSQFSRKMKLWGLRKRDRDLNANISDEPNKANEIEKEIVKETLTDKEQEFLNILLGMESAQPSGSAAQQNLQLVCDDCRHVFSNFPGYHYHITKKPCIKDPPPGGFKWFCQNCLQGFITKQGSDYHRLKGVCTTVE